MSSKGQVVIPKEMRDALHLRAGETLSVSRQGRRIVMEAGPSAGPRISYEEFRRRIPRHTGEALTIEQMNAAVDAMFAEKKAT